MLCAELNVMVVAQTLNTSNTMFTGFPFYPSVVKNRLVCPVVLHGVHNIAASINGALGLKVEVVVKHTRHTGHHGAGVLTWRKVVMSTDVVQIAAFHHDSYSSDFFSSELHFLFFLQKKKQS